MRQRLNSKTPWSRWLGACDRRCHQCRFRTIWRSSFRLAQSMCSWCSIIRKTFFVHSPAATMRSGAPCPGPARSWPHACLPEMVVTNQHPLLPVALQSPLVHHQHPRARLVGGLNAGCVRVIMPHLRDLIALTRSL
jgi:hypothetical protein